MAIKKYAESEGELTVLRGKEAAVLSNHIAKTGKKVSDFSEDELRALNVELDGVRDEESDSQSEEAK